MRTTDTLRFRPRLDGFEERAVPATLIEVLSLTGPASSAALAAPASESKPGTEHPRAAIVYTPTYTPPGNASRGPRKEFVPPSAATQESAAAAPAKPARPAASVVP